MGESVIPYKGRDAAKTIEAVLELYEQGKEIEQASDIVGVPARTIYRWLDANASERWKEALKARALADHERCVTNRSKAREALEQLKQTLDDEEVTQQPERQWRLAHAREVLAAADRDLEHQKWKLERLLSKLYGQTSKLQVEVSGDLGDRLRRAKERVIDSECSAIDAPHNAHNEQENTRSQSEKAPE
jgi:transposase